MELMDSDLHRVLQSQQVSILIAQIIILRNSLFYSYSTFCRF